jgi:hypothetical protein
MRLFARADAHAPDAVRKVVGNERLLAWAMSADDMVVAATPTGLWWAGSPTRELELLPWWRIDKAVWRDELLTITAADVDDMLLVERRAVSVRLAEPGAVPAVVRKRVEGSIRKNEHVDLPSGSVRVVARTVAGQDGLTWLARLEPGSYDSPALRAELTDLITQLTEQSDAALKS